MRLFYFKQIRKFLVVKNKHHAHINSFLAFILSCRCYNSGINLLDNRNDISYKHNHISNTRAFVCFSFNRTYHLGVKSLWGFAINNFPIKVVNNF